MSKEEERGGLDTEGEEEVGEKEKGEENEREEGDDDSEDEEEESEEEEVGIALQLPQRATRGLAYQRLIGEALEEDQAFWSHNTWADEEEDADYNCSEGEEVYEDVIDSDFDRPEDDEEGDSSSDGEGEEGDEGEGRRRRGTPTTKQGNRKERKGKKKRRRDTEEEDEEEAGEEKKKSRKQAFELMWKRRQAKREREERQRKEEKKKARARKHYQQKREEEEKRRPEVKSEEEQRLADRRGKEQEEKPQLKQGVKERLLEVKTRQLRLTRGRRLRRGDGSSSSSTSDEQENKGSSSSSSSQKRKHRQKQKKPAERPRTGGGTVREMTLEEHLEEARRTEEKNLAVLLAMEERDEARRLRHVFDLKKSMYAGDYDRYFSWASWLVVGDQATEEAEAAPAAETAAADTEPLEHMHQEVKTHQEQQANTQKQQWHTNTETATTFCDSKVEIAERMKTGKGEETEEKEAATAAAPATQRDTDESHGAEKSGVYLRSVKEEDAIEGEAGKHNMRAAEGPATAAAAAKPDAAGSNDGAASASSLAGEERGTERRKSETFGCGMLEGKEEIVQGNEECSTKFSSLLQVSNDSLDLSPQERGEQQLLQHRAPEQQHLSRQQGAQTQQQRQTSEERLGQQHVELEQKPTQQQTVDHMPSGCTPAAEKAAAGETRTRLAGDEEDGEEPRESEGYAMELRMFTEGKFPDMYIQQPASAPTPHPRCIITGQRAKYRDPLTGAPYATLHAFKCLRDTFQQVREQHLLHVLQQIKDVLGATQSTAHDNCCSTSVAIGKGLALASPPVASALPSAAAGDNSHGYRPSDVPDGSVTISGSSGSTSGYTSILGGKTQGVPSQQLRQRRATIGQTVAVKKNSLTNKLLTSISFPNGGSSCIEASTCDGVPVSVGGWSVSKEGEQKRRRNARNAATCGRKAGSSRTAKKV